MIKKIFIFGFIVLLTGCGTKVYKRGHLISPRASEEVGSVRTKADVFNILGTPGAISLYGKDDVWMYLSYEKEQTAFFTPNDTKYDLIIFRFAKGSNKVSEIKRYDLSQKVGFNPDSSETPVPGAIELSPLEELFNNVGKFNPVANGQ
ncbi:MAG: hypothetical protein JXR30_01280 [Alphaproteobacteria bacterium]|nr:hypothetical protein [Alphaproteobacteria bacterium]